MDNADVIDQAIKNRSVLTLNYKGEGRRTVEPHVHYMDRENVALVLTWQTGGFSHRGNLPNFRQFYLDDITEIEVQSATFMPRADYRKHLDEQARIITSV